MQAEDAAPCYRGQSTCRRCRTPGWESSWLRIASIAANLLESLLVEKIQTEQSILIPHRNRRPVLIQRPFDAHDHLVGGGDVGDVSERNTLIHLLLEREAGLRVVLHTGQLRIDLEPA